MHGVSGGRNLNVQRKVNNVMDLPPDTFTYVFIWTFIGVVACIVSVIIEDKEL
jgi:hypothetical protein